MAPDCALRVLDRLAGLDEPELEGLGGLRSTEERGRGREDKGREGGGQCEPSGDGDEWAWAFRGVLELKWGEVGLEFGLRERGLGCFHLGISSNSWWVD